jgi:hypothetical protein
MTYDPVWINGNQQNKKDGKLNAEADEVYQHNGKRYDQSGKVYFPEKLSILNEGKCSTGETLGKKRP